MPSKASMPPNVRRFWSLIRWLLPLAWLAIIGSLGILEHADWKYFFYPALDAYISGDSPFMVEGIYSPPWFFMLLQPLMLLGLNASAFLLEYGSLVVLYTGLLLFLRDNKRLLIGFALLSPLNIYVLNQIWLAQIDILFTFTSILLTVLVARKEEYYVWYAGIALLFLSLKPPSGIWLAFYLFYLVPTKEWWKMLLIPFAIGMLNLIVDYALIMEFIETTLNRLGPSERPVWDVTIIGVARFAELSGIWIVSLCVVAVGWIVYLWRQTTDFAERVMLVTIAGLLVNAYVGWHHLILLFAISVPLILRRSTHPVIIITLFMLGLVPIIRLYMTGADIISTVVVLILLTVTQPYQEASESAENTSAVV
ncbi:MAG: hypothetical protein AAFV98_11595 [Chloroflexota bacterium]